MNTQNVDQDKNKKIDEIKYNVVKNIEGQYSIFPSYRNVPAGWTVEGDEKTREECLEYINEVWIDMRPLSLRESLSV